VKFNLTFASLGHENRENYVSRHKYVLERICMDPSIDGVATVNVFFAALVTSVTSALCDTLVLMCHRAWFLRMSIGDDPREKDE
jgi:hypothetical protein